MIIEPNLFHRCSLIIKYCKALMLLWNEMKKISGRGYYSWLFAYNCTALYQVFHQPLVLLPVMSRFQTTPTIKRHFSSRMISDHKCTYITPPYWGYPNLTSDKFCSSPPPVLLRARPARFNTAKEVVFFSSSSSKIGLSTSCDGAGKAVRSWVDSPLIW